MNRKASIIVLNWNGKRYLEECLHALFTQTYSPYEIILVDNGSHDGSVDFVAERFPAVRIIENGENLGFAAGNNVAIRVARGDYIVTLNNDTRAEPDWLEELVKVVETDPKIGMCASKMLFYYHTGILNSTGISLDNEAKGLIPTREWKKRQLGESWHRGETLNIAIGQGYNLTTPIQMLTLIAAVGNGGILYQPQIIKKIEMADGVGVTDIEPTQTGKLPVSTKTMNIVKRGLWEAVNTRGGTARGIRHKEFSICGKTGTAQLVARKEPEEGMPESEEEELADHLKPHAWFVAYAPSEDPLIAVAVMVEHGEHGSSAAAPIAREIIQTYIIRINRKTQIASTKIQINPDT